MIARSESTTWATAGSAERAAVVAEDAADRRGETSGRRDGIAILPRGGSEEVGVAAERGDEHPVDQVAVRVRVRHRPGEQPHLHRAAGAGVDPDWPLLGAIRHDAG